MKHCISKIYVNNVKSNGTLLPLPLGYNFVLAWNGRGLGICETLVHLNLESSVTIFSCPDCAPLELDPFMVYCPTSTSG